MEIIIFCTTFNRHSVLPTFVQNINSYVATTNINATLIIVDATMTAICPLALGNVETLSKLIYLHEPGCSFYRSMKFAIPYIKPRSTVFFVSDEEFGSLSREAIDLFNSSEVDIGVPNYTISSRHFDDSVFLFTGWLQLKYIAELSLLKKISPVNLAKEFAGEGIVSYYQLYKGDHFIRMGLFFSELADFMESIYPDTERACETIWSISNLLSRQLFLPEFSYFRKVDRRDYWRTVHMEKRWKNPVVHWEIWPRWKKDNAVYYNAILEKCRQFWSDVSLMPLEFSDVEFLIFKHALGYKDANSRKWRTWPDFVLYRDEITDEKYHPVKKIGWYHKDHPIVKVDSKLTFTKIELLRYRDSWVNNKWSRNTFFLLGVDFFFIDEDIHLLSK